MKGNEDGGGGGCASMEALPQRMDDVLPAYLLPCFKYETLTKVQQRVLRAAFKEQSNMMVCAPTGSGKTVVMEAAFLQCHERSRGLAAAKAVYIAPVKALLQERLKDWRFRFGERTIGMTFVELSGDSTDLDDDDVAKADVILTTPEKWDAVMRNMHCTGSKTNPAMMTELLLIDEIHHIGDVSRGATLEAVTCRMMKISQREKDARSGLPIQHLRIVGMSATFSNAEDLSSWIQCPPAYLFQFGSEFRPVPLTCRVIGCGDASNDFTFERNLDGRIVELIRQHSGGKSSLVFCNSRIATTRLATFLAQELKRMGMFDAKKRDRTAYLDQLDERPSSKLEISLQAGVGYHHAGLSTTDRDIVENLFRENKLLILCCTSSLAVGVNLPAHLVIIKSTRIYQGSQGYTEYPDSQLLQMVGRAGRPGFDSSGTAIILAENSRVTSLQRLMSGEAPIVIKSQLAANLLSVLNAEVAQGLITNLVDARVWLQSTFLANQLRREEKQTASAEMVEIDTVLQQLIDGKLVSMDAEGYISSTIAGSKMCQGYVKFTTMQAIAAFGDAPPTMAELLNVISRCDEVRLPLRRQEKSILNQLVESSVRYRTSSSQGSSTVVSDEAKTNTLIQAVLSNAIIPDDRLLEESANAVIAAERLLGVVVEYLLCIENAEALLSAVRLQRCLRLRAWDDATGRESLRHVCGDSIVVASLEYIGIRSIRQLADADPVQIDSVLRRNPPVGKQLVEKASSLNDFRVIVAWRPKGRRSKRMLKITVTSMNRGHRGSATLLVWTSAKLLHFHTKICDSYEVEVVLRETSVCPIHVRVLNDEIPGLDSRLEIEPPKPRVTKKMSATENMREPTRRPESCQDGDRTASRHDRSSILDSILELEKRHTNAKQQRISQFLVKKKPSTQSSPEQSAHKLPVLSRTPIVVEEAKPIQVPPRKRPRVERVNQDDTRLRARCRVGNDELVIIPLESTRVPKVKSKQKISTTLFDKFRFKGPSQTKPSAPSATLPAVPQIHASLEENVAAEEFLPRPSKPGLGSLHVKSDRTADHPFLQTYLRENEDALRVPRPNPLLQEARSSIEYSLYERVLQRHGQTPEDHADDAEDTEDDPFGAHVIPSEDPFSSIFF